MKTSSSISASFSLFLVGFLFVSASFATGSKEPGGKAIYVKILTKLSGPACRKLESVNVVGESNLAVQRTDLEYCVDGLNTPAFDHISLPYSDSNDLIDQVRNKYCAANVGEHAKFDVSLRDASGSRFPLGWVTGLPSTPETVFVNAIDNSGAYISLHVNCK